MDADIVVVGAGVVGLAIGCRLAEAGFRVTVLERDHDLGRGISSRTSQVIHAGIYYQTGSLKARLCREGKRRLYEYCEKNDVRVARTGKLFVAADETALAKLDVMKQRAAANGVDDLRELDRAALRRLEPEVSGAGALLSPSSGVVDAMGYIRSLASRGAARGMRLMPDAPATSAEPVQRMWKIAIGGPSPRFVTSRVVVNAAGLHAVALSRAVFPARPLPPFVPTKGSYARLSGPSPIRHIIYPALVPGQIEERVDATPGLDGVLRFGPSVEPVGDLDDFSPSPDIAARLAPAVRRYLPNLDPTRLSPDYAGIRPKLYRPRDPVEDFRIEWSPEPGWLDLWGIESPGLTSSLAIGEYVHDMMMKSGVLA